jgi:hypothetical protein
MAGSVNKVILVGNLGADPEVKSFQNGGRIANLRIATSEDWKDRQTGEKKERTEWHQVVLQSDGLVGVAERYLRKGQKVYIEGQLRKAAMIATRPKSRLAVLTASLSCSTARVAVKVAAVPAAAGVAVRPPAAAQVAVRAAATGRVDHPALAAAVLPTTLTTTFHSDH